MQSFTNSLTRPFANGFANGFGFGRNRRKDKNVKPANKMSSKDFKRTKAKGREKRSSEDLIPLFKPSPEDPVILSENHIPDGVDSIAQRMDRGRQKGRQPKLRKVLRRKRPRRRRPKANEELRKSSDKEENKARGTPEDSLRRWEEQGYRAPKCKSIPKKTCQQVR